VVLLAAVLYTVFTSKEYTPEELAAFEEDKAKTTGLSYEIKQPVTFAQYLKMD